MEENLRTPIVTVAGHVDHGKTTILDSIRRTCVQEQEAGGITQRISFTKVPLEKIKERCRLLKEERSSLQVEVKIPGFLFIDTPGHAAFSNLRKRGGSLADLSILVIDINEGIMPQTQEVINILRIYKTPFVVALNKIDKITGWTRQSEKLKENIENQLPNTKLEFDEKLLKIIAALQNHGFKSNLFYEIQDFTKELALIPCSGRTGEGIDELIMVLIGLSQRFLTKQLTLTEEAKGVILEIKKEKSMVYLECVLYDGKLRAGEEIVIGSFDEPVLSKIRVLEEILPVSDKFQTVKVAKAATGVRMQVVTDEEILAGMPFLKYTGNLDELRDQLKKEVGEKIKTDDRGIIVKADSLGSLEALITMLRQKNIPIVSAGIGKINKKDFILAKTNVESDPLNAIILGFNTEEDEETLVLSRADPSVKIIKNEVIYRLIEDLEEFQKEKENEIKRAKLGELAAICQSRILHNFVFRNSNPAIFGVAVEEGKLVPGTPLIDEEGNYIGKVKGIQENNHNVAEAEKGKEVAISIPGTNFERQLSDKNILYSDITEYQYRKFKENKELLSIGEIKILQKIAEIKRREKITWGL